MATKSNRSFVSGTQTPEQIQREFIQKPLESAKQTLMGTGLELFNLLSVLPDAFIASQRRELKRVKATTDKDDQRVATIEASITQATQLRTTIQRGDARVQRALGSLTHSDDAFHGFVSNTDLEPIGGLIVRLTGREGGTAKRALSGTTDKDGYFRIPFGSKREGNAKLSFSERLDNVSAPGDANATATSDTAASSKRLAQVEILQNDKVVHTDQFALPVEEGSVYREYVIAGKAAPQKERDSSSDVSDDTEINLSEKLLAKKAASKKTAGKAAKKKASKK